MFDIGWSELLIIAVVALIVIGPKELPEVMRNVGRAINKMRRSADDFRRHFEESARDTGYEDIQQNLREFRQLNPANQIRESIDRALNSDGTSYTPAVELPKPAAAAPESPASANAEPASTPAIDAPPAGAVPVPFDSAPYKAEPSRTEHAAIEEEAPPSLRNGHDGAPHGNGPAASAPSAKAS